MDRELDVTSADGTRIHVTERGDAGPDRPTVVLVHGYPDTSAVWNPVADRLVETGHHVVAHDVRGAGRSGAPAKRLAGYALDRLVDDLEAVLDAVVPRGSGVPHGRTVHLVGHDWGSIQSWESVAGGRLDGRLASYTSISGPCLDHVGSRRKLPPRQLLRSAYIPFFHLPLAAPLGWRLLARRWATILRRREGVATDARWPAPTLAADAAHGVNLYRANVLPRLLRPRERATDLPVLLVCPDGDGFVGPAYTSGLDRWAPNLERVEVEGGHWIVRSHPDTVADLVAGFVARTSVRSG